MKRLKTLCLRAGFAVMCLFGSSAVYGLDFDAELTSANFTTSTVSETNTSNPDFFGNMLRKKYAGLVQATPKDISNTKLYSFIDQWYGTPYLWGGTTQAGVDCSALVQNMFRNVFNTDIVRTSITQYGMSQLLPSRDSLNEGDLVFFKTRGNFISHVGVYLKNNLFVHSCSSKGVTISSLDENYWNRVYAAAGRISKTMDTVSRHGLVAMN